MSTLRSQLADLDLEIDKLEESVKGGRAHEKSVSDTLRKRGNKSKEPTGTYPLVLFIIFLCNSSCFN